MRRLLVRLFHILLIIVPFAFTSWSDELFEFNKMIAVYSISVCILTVWIWRMISEKRIIFRKTPLLLPLLIYLLSQVLSTAFSININTSIFGYYSRFHGGLLSTLAYLSLYFAATSNLEKKDVLPLIKSAVLAGVGVAMYAIPEHYGVSPSCVIITKEFTASCWVQDVQTRVFATFGQPNWLAAYQLMLIPLAFWLWVTQLQEKTIPLWKRHWPFMAIFLMTLTLYYTRSRSGFLALIMMTGLMFIAYLLPLAISFFQKKISLPDQKPLVFIFVFFPLFLGLIVGTPYTPTLWERLQKLQLTPAQTSESDATTSETEGKGVSPTVSTTALENGGTDSGKIRQIVWKGAFAVWQRYPILGSGLETFAYSYYKDRPQEHNLVSEWDYLYNKAHNEYLNTLATAGAFGLASLLIFLGGTTLRMIQQWYNALKTKKSIQDIWLPICLGAGLVGAVVTNFFGFSTVMITVLTFLFPAFIEIWLLEDSTAKQKVAGLIQAVKTKSFVRKQKDEIELNLDSDWIGSSFVGLIAGFLLLSIFSMWNNDRMLASAKADIGSGDAVAGYKKLDSLTRHAPHEPLFWNEKSLALAQIVAASYKEDPTVAGKLIEEVIRSSDNAVKLNNVHLNYWKSRARVFLLLSITDEKYLVDALQTLQKAQELSPTDAKVAYNQALIYESLKKPQETEQWYRKAIELRPIYEEARQSYGKFLEAQGNYQAAIEQYKYVTDNLNTTNDEARKHWQDLEASLSAKKKKLQ